RGVSYVAPHRDEPPPIDGADRAGGHPRRVAGPGDRFGLGACREMARAHRGYCSPFRAPALPAHSFPGGGLGGGRRGPLRLSYISSCCSSTSGRKKPEGRTSRITRRMPEVPAAPYIDDT